jgi:hypothetical protein
MAFRHRKVLIVTLSLVTCHFLETVVGISYLTKSKRGSGGGFLYK